MTKLLLDKLGLRPSTSAYGNRDKFPRADCLESQRLSLFDATSFLDAISFAFHKKSASAMKFGTMSSDIIAIASFEL